MTLQTDTLKAELSKIAVALEFGGQEAGRSERDRSFLGQISIYLAHTNLGLTQAETARVFGRHHSTVSHACGVIEDQRTDPVFDSKICKVEQFLERAP